MSIVTLLGELDTVGYAFVSQLLSFFWQSSIVLIATLLLLSALRKHSASIRHGMLVTALLAIPLIPATSYFVTTIGMPRAPISIIPDYRPQASVTSSHQVITENVQSSSETTPTSVTEELDSPLNHSWALSLVIFIVTILTFLSLVVYGRLRIAWWRRNSRVVCDRSVLDTFTAAAEQIGVRQRYLVVENPHIEASFISGNFFSVILLPEGLSSSLSRRELRNVALHELAHIKRHDPLIFTIVSLARVLLFFHPLVWIVSRWISQLAEEACDEVVLGFTRNPLDYAKTLTKIAESLTRRRLQMQLSAGILISKRVFFERIRTILSTKNRKARPSSKAQLIIVFLVIFVAYGVAISSPLIGKTEAATPIFTVYSTADGSSSSIGREDEEDPSDGIEIRMTPEEAMQELGEPKRIYDHATDNDKKIYVWKRKKLIFNTKTTLIVFENDRAVMITTSSDDIPNPIEYVLNTEKELAKIEDERHEVETISEVEAREPWVSMLFIIRRLQVSGAEFEPVDNTTLSNFEGITETMKADDVVALLGDPVNKKSKRKGGHRYFWEYHDNRIEVNFAEDKVIAKTLETPDLKVKIEHNYWSANTDNLRIKVIND